MTAVRKGGFMKGSASIVVGYHFRWSFAESAGSVVKQAKIHYVRGSS